MADPNPQAFEHSHGFKAAPAPVALLPWLMLAVSLLSAAAATAMADGAGRWVNLGGWALGWFVASLLWWRWSQAQPQRRPLLGYGVMASVAALVLYVLEPAMASVALMIWLSAGSLLLWGASPRRLPGLLGVALAAANALAVVMAVAIGAMLGQGTNLLNAGAPWQQLMVLLLPVFCHAWLGIRAAQAQRQQMGTRLKALELECAQLQQSYAELQQVVNTAGHKDLLTGVDSLPRCMEFMDQLRERNARKVEAFCAVLVELDPWVADASLAADAKGLSAHDKVQLMLSDLLSTELRAVDRVGRHTPETFLLVLADTTSIQTVWVLHRIRESMHYGQWSAVRTKAAGVSKTPTLTMSVAQYRAGETAEQMLLRLEAALQHGHATGRDQIVIAEDLKH